MSPTQSHHPKARLETRLALEALKLKEAAKAFPHGRERAALIRKARQFETASHLNEWLSSPGLQPPR
jgi:hypothetical protein